MKYGSGFLMLASLICVSMLAGVPQDEQKKPVVKPDDEPMMTIDSRVERLEKHVSILEGILFASVKLETKRAERQLAQRREHLKNSRELFARGMITRIELRYDRGRVEEAQLELDLAIGGSNQRRLVCELELADARRNLEFAKDQLNYRRNMAQRGFASAEEVAALAESVEVAREGLEFAKSKLEAVEELDSID